LRRRKLIIILTTIAVVLVALAYSFLQTPVYRASAEVLLDERASDAILNPDQQTNSVDRQSRVQTEIEVMRSRLVRDAVRDELGYTPTVTIATKGETSVVSISATDTAPERAAREANAYATTFIDVRREANIADLTEAAEVLEGQLTEIDTQISDQEAVVADLQAEVDAAPDDLTRAQETERDAAQATLESQRVSLATQRNEYSSQLGELRLAVNTTRIGGGQVVSQAVAPGSPFAPDPVRNASVALVLGLLLGAGLAFLRDYLDDTVRTKDDLDTLTGGLEVLGLIPLVEGWKDHARPQLVSVSAPTSPAAEAYRGLRTSLQFMGIDRDIRLVQFTSASASEGKTTTLSNIGVALARAGNRVIMVDCDLRRPRLHQFFGLDNSVGFTTAILGEVDITDAIIDIPDVLRLSVVASGPPPPNPSELLSTRAASTMLGSLVELADYVLIDCPPLLPVSDAVIIAGTADATVLITSVDNTTKRNLSRAMEVLRQVDAPLIGAVLNGLDESAAYAYSYGDGYGYAASYAHSDNGRSRFGRRRGRARVGSDDAAQARLPHTVPDDRE
ncbi:polysaccharide biosynthesis tyrosine autokinase, partial [Iamia sp.]|uniref:polysaccharide biosynthesis tyrosine autokinase n=1 Tax=Iamia sp. TaxID=2722710 RepID=UPI002BBEE7F4